MIWAVALSSLTKLVLVKNALPVHSVVVAAVAAAADTVVAVVAVAVAVVVNVAAVVVVVAAAAGIAVVVVAIGANPFRQHNKISKTRLDPSRVFYCLMVWGIFTNKLPNRKFSSFKDTAGGGYFFATSVRRDQYQMILPSSVAR